jgi:hypothetical protein
LEICGIFHREPPGLLGTRTARTIKRRIARTMA